MPSSPWPPSSLPNAAAAAAAAAPSAAAAAAAAAASFSSSATTAFAFGRSIPLYSPADQEHLSPLVCLMRSQLELFSATPADVAERAAIGGISQQITPGRVGIRCVHCKAQQQAKGSTSYPTSLRILHQVSEQLEYMHNLLRNL